MHRWRSHWFLFFVLSTRSLLLRDRISPLFFFFFFFFPAPIPCVRDIETPFPHCAFGLKSSSSRAQVPVGVPQRSARQRKEAGEKAGLCPTVTWPFVWNVHQKWLKSNLAGICSGTSQPPVEVLMNSVSRRHSLVVVVIICYWMSHSRINIIIIVNILLLMKCLE